MGTETLTATDIFIVEQDYDDFKTTITPSHQGNLLTLAMYLLGLPADYPDFAMELFVNDDERGYGWHTVFVAGCGTAACAVGHAPAAGIAFLEGEQWVDYSYRTLIPQPVDEDGYPLFKDSRLWNWCFSEEWSQVDNTAHGAAHRILTLLRDRDIPADADEQREGEAPISYLPEVTTAVEA